MAEPVLLRHAPNHPHPPTPGSLAPGVWALDMSTRPPSLYVGVPEAVDASGMLAISGPNAYVGINGYNAVVPSWAALNLGNNITWNATLNSAYEWAYLGNGYAFLQVGSPGGSFAFGTV